MKTTTKLLSVLVGTCLSSMASAAPITTIWTPTDSDVNLLEITELTGDPDITVGFFDDSTTDFTTTDVLILVRDDRVTFKVTEAGWLASNAAGDSLLLGDTQEFQLAAFETPDGAWNHVDSFGDVPGANTIGVNFVAGTQLDLLVVDATARTSAVPVPAAVWLFGSGLLGLIGVARRKNT